MNKKYVYYYATLIGKVGIAEDGTGITNVFLGDFPIHADVKETELIKEAAKQHYWKFHTERREAINK